MPLTGLKYGVMETKAGEEEVAMLLKGADEVGTKPPGVLYISSRMLRGRWRWLSLLTGPTRGTPGSS